MIQAVAMMDAVAMVAKQAVAKSKGQESSLSFL
jgi:hypothetical protein